MIFGYDNKVFYVIAVCLMIIWAGFMVFFWIKADEITRDPCSICSEYQGDSVTCTIGGLIPVSRTYYPNGTIVEDRPRVQQDYPIINYSGWLNGS